MTKFTEFHKECFHCNGTGYTAGVYAHQMAIDLLVDAADAARFSSDEAQKLYRLAAKYEDSAADQQEQDHKGRRLAKVPWTAAVHRRNAIYLRALADQDVRPAVTRTVVRIRMQTTSRDPSTISLKLVTDDPAS